MNSTRNFAWTMIILGAAAGCAEDTQTAAPPAGGASTPTAVGKAAPGTKTPDGKVTPVAEPPKKSDEAPAVEGPKAENTKPAPALTADELAEIKKLPAAEQTPATAQVICPVSAHNLGSMGMPIKVTAEGRTAYLCCEGCEEKFKSDPKAYFAKLDKK